MDFTNKDIVELRKKTGAGMMDCKEALKTSNNLEEAIICLRKKGLAEIKTREAKSDREGTIGYYLHTGNRVGVMVEVSCETDFVAKSDCFRDFAHQIALQVAASSPAYITRDQVPQSVIDREKEIIAPTLQGKPEAVIEKIVAGKLDKVYKEVCLMEQLFVKNADMTISDLLGDLAAKVGEKITIKRFVKFVVGE